MPNWKQVLDEMGKIASSEDFVRRKYIKRLASYTKRNVIVYYSGWLQKPPTNPIENYELMINDNDINGFMTTINKLPRERGLDLVLHTPGGEISATQTIVEYITQMFTKPLKPGDEPEAANIRVIVPQLAMSAGTMITCGCNRIMMGKQSSLGPMDPQYRGMAAHAVVEEFETAIKDCKADRDKIPLWQPIIAKYNPTLIGECIKVNAMTEELVSKWLKRGMFLKDPDADDKIELILRGMADHKTSKTHERHFTLKDCESMGLIIEKMEDDQKLQDLILSVHHSCLITLMRTPACKIIENQLSSSYILRRDVKPLILPVQGRGPNIPFVMTPSQIPPKKPGQKPQLPKKSSK